MVVLNEELQGHNVTSVVVGGIYSRSVLVWPQWVRICTLLAVELVCLTESHPNLLEASNLSGRLSRRIHHVHAISTTNPGFILPHHHHVH